MIRRREAQAVFGGLARALRAGDPAAVATVVELRGSGYRRPGARMLVLYGGRRGAGGISGGCLEHDVLLHADAAMRHGEPRLLCYDTSSRDHLGLGLGCDGAVEVLVRPYTPMEADEMAALAAVLESREAVRVATCGAGIEFEEVLEPPPRLLVCGSGVDSRPIGRLAEQVGFEVLSMVRDTPIPHDTGPDDFAVVKTHHFERDRVWLQTLVSSSVRYIGLMGPRNRVARLRDEVGGDGRIYGPVGLDLAAEGEDQVAVAIVAELLAVRSGRKPGHLRQRTAAIHDAAPHPRS